MAVLAPKMVQNPHTRRTRHTAAMQKCPIYGTSLALQAGGLCVPMTLLEGEKSLVAKHPENGRNTAYDIIS